MTTPKIAVLGLGAMGARMARRLLDAGHDLTVYNRTPARAAQLVAQGARLAASPREAAVGRDIVLCIVRDDAASRAIWFDPEHGALAGLEKGATAIESSTLTLGWTKELAAAAAERGHEFVDAPVAGSRPQAEAGQLAFLVGGSERAVTSIRPGIKPMAGAVHHVGPVGTGMTMKLVVNALFALQVEALAEVLGLAERAGIPRERALSTLGELPVTSPALKGVGALMATGKLDPMFPIELVEKDLGYVQATADALGADCPVTAAAREVFGRAKERGLWDKNISAIAELFSP